MSNGLNSAYRRRRQTTDEEYKKLQEEYTKQDIVKLRLKDFKPTEIPDWMKYEGEDSIKPGEIYAYALPRWISHTDYQAYSIAIATDEKPEAIIFYPMCTGVIEDSPTIKAKPRYNIVKNLTKKADVEDPVAEMQRELDKANSVNKELELENSRLKALLASIQGRSK